MVFVPHPVTCAEAILMFSDTVPSGNLVIMTLPVPSMTGSEKCNVRFVSTGTLTAPSIGVNDVTVGPVSATSRKRIMIISHVVTGLILPARSVARN